MFGTVFDDEIVTLYWKSGLENENTIKLHVTTSPP